MEQEYQRSERVGIQIQRILSQLIMREIKDPRLKMINIIDAVVARDFAKAKVYFSSIGDDSTPEELTAVLNKAAGYLRKELGQQIQLRHTPALEFIYDSTNEKANELELKIAEALNKK